MSRNRRRAVAIAVVGGFAVAPLVSACAAGQHPQTTYPTQLAEGVNASAHLVDIRNAFLLGPAPGQRLAAGDSAPLYVWFVNKALSPDRLVAVEAPGVAQSVQLAGGAVVLPPGRLVATVEAPGAKQAPAQTPTPTPSKATPSKSAPSKSPKGSATPSATPTASTAPTQAPASATSSKVILKGLTKGFGGGETVRLTLHFQQAGTITLNVPVTQRNGYYATYSPAPAAAAPTPTPTTTPSATPLPKKSPKAAKAKKPSATPTA